MKGLRLASVLVVAAAGLLLGSCNSPTTSNPGPQFGFAGTWTTTITSPTAATGTLVVSGTSWTLDYNGAGGTAHETATLSQVDETAAHFVLTVNSASGTGAFASPPFGPNDFFYIIYTMFGNSFQIEDNGTNVSTYRTSFDVNAQVWSK